METRQSYRFGKFEFDLQKRLLWREGKLVPLAPKLAETLALLVVRDGDLVEKGELIARVWPDTVVEENSLSQNISTLRKLLGSGQDGREYIETVARRGYRFVANGKDNEAVVILRDLTAETTGAVNPVPDPASEQPAYHFQISRRRLHLAMLCGLIAIAGIAVLLIAIRHRLVSEIPKTIQEIEFGPERLRQYDFEDGTQGWVAHSMMMITHVASSTEHAYSGHRSLAIYFDGRFSRKAQVYVAYPQIPAEAMIRAHVWCPEKSGLSAIALFIEQRDHSWYNDWRSTSNLVAGAWNNLYLHVPADAALPLQRLGFEFTSESEWRGTCYLDAVEW